MLYYIPDGKADHINFEKACDIAKGMNAIVENLEHKATQDDINDFSLFYEATLAMANGAIELDLYHIARDVCQKFQEPQKLAHLFPRGSIEMYNTLFSPIFMLPLVKQNPLEKTEIEDITHSVNAVALISPKKKALLFRKENKSPKQADVAGKQKQKQKPKLLKNLFKKK